MPASDIVVTVNGTDRTRFTNRYECSVDQNGDGSPDSAVVMVRGFTPTVGMEVSIVQNVTVTVFDGEITDLELVQRRNGTRKRYRCTCTDWNFLLDRRLVIGSWTATAADTIVSSIVSGFTSGFTTTNVQGSLAAVDFSAFLEPVSAVLKRLADAIGATFKLIGKDVYFRTTSNIANPATLDATNKTFKALTYRQTIQQIRNRVYVQGAATTVAGMVPVGSPFAPVGDGTLFAAGGGKALTSAQILTYTSTVLGSAIPAPVVTWGGITLIFDGGANGLTVGATYIFALTWKTAAGETGISNVSPSPVSPPDATHRSIQVNWTIANVPPSVTGLWVYASTDAGATWKTVLTIASGPYTTTWAAQNVQTQAPPAASTAGNDTITGSTTTGAISVGATSIAVAEIGVFASGGGIFTYAKAGVTYAGTYTGRSTASGAGSLTGIPATGNGSIVVSIASGAAITNVPGIKGIPTSGTGSVGATLNAGDPIAIFVQRDDAASQAAIAAAEGGDGIHEFPLFNAALQTDAACNAYGDAELTLGKNIQESSTYVSEDSATVPGASAVINIAGISTTIPIAHVAISWVAGRKNPQRAVTATSQFKTFSQYLADIQKQAAAA